MHIEAVAVTSKDGKLADNKGDAYSWVSPEDQQLFTEIKSGYSLIVMGRKTYEAIKGQLRLSPEILRIVLTHTPQQYESDMIPNELEFISAEPIPLVEAMEQRGYTSMLIAGGSQVYTEFAQTGLINRFHVTVEPVILGEGLPLADHLDLETHANVIERTQLNTKGTVHTVYEFNTYYANQDN